MASSAVLDRRKTQIEYANFSLLVGMALHVERFERNSPESPARVAVTS